MGRAVSPVRNLPVQNSDSEFSGRRLILVCRCWVSPEQTRNTNEVLSLRWDDSNNDDDDDMSTLSINSNTDSNNNDNSSSNRWGGPSRPCGWCG